ncbi:MAG: 23S rRNA (uracil(1939)-C(5))-methyltransferase RlmD [Bacteroidales bacterium]
MRKKKPQVVLHDITMENLAAEGKSLAHVDGKVLFVPFAIPGDILDIKVVRKKSSYMEGRIEKIIKPSPDRIKPFCEHFELCGGCKWQSLPYELQIKHKQQQVEDQLNRIGHLKLPEISPILGSDRTTGYRNKLEYTFSDRKWIMDGEDPDDFFSGRTELDPNDFKDGVFPRHLRKGYSMVNHNPKGFGLGFHLGGHFDKVLDINKCYLQDEPSNEIRLFVKAYSIEHGLSFFNLREQVGVMRNLIIRNNVKGDVMLTLVVTSLGEKDENTGNEKVIDLLNALLAKFPQIKSLHYVINTKANDNISDLDVVNFAGDDAIYEEMEDLRFKIGPKSFYQTNSLQAYKLYSVVRDFADLKGDERIYDLYTGTGTIALFLSKNARNVIGIEYVQEAINDANVNAKNNNIENCDFFAGDMKDILTEDFISEHGGTPDLIVLDPPRAGIHPDVAKVILKAAPAKMVYVSCNPATQARDLEVFSEEYDILAVQPVDMFPHTHHVENVVSLRRK